MMRHSASIAGVVAEWRSRWQSETMAGVAGRTVSWPERLYPLEPAADPRTVKLPEVVDCDCDGAGRVAIRWP